MHFKIETVSALPTNFSHRKLRLRADRKSGVPVRQPPGWPVAPLRLQAYRDTARSLGYPLAVVSLVKLTLRALLSGTFLQRKDVNQCLGVWVKLGQTASMPDSSATLSPGRCVTLLLPVLLVGERVGELREAGWKHE